ncbi:MAG: helix-turn-helix transcriptional regulator [Cytophagales bacterium]|nr:helix-turn-helix transcriptional regulator [Cytophagales bacterium]
MQINQKTKHLLFWGISSITILSGIIYLFILESNSTLNILPTILKTRNHVEPLRKANTFAEDYTTNASYAQAVYTDSSFTFKYKKSEKQQHAFAGAWFPLENTAIDFESYDAIQVGIKAEKTKRIPLNFTVQNHFDTYQYIRHFIEIRENQEIYTLQFDDFFTPNSWYERNKIAQVDIPSPDLSLINTMSFESCGLLNANVEDQYTIFRLVLIKDITLHYIVTISLLCVCIGACAVWSFGIFQKKPETEVIHVPVETVEYEYEDKVEDKVLAFLAENYTNPNLTLSDLTKEFGKNSRELSTIIKEKTKMTFPKYINFLRIEQAKRILISKNYQSISDIGYSVGFNSPSNFNRVFKEREGVTPKKFNINT